MCNYLYLKNSHVIFTMHQAHGKGFTNIRSFNSHREPCEEGTIIGTLC